MNSTKTDRHRRILQQNGLNEDAGNGPSWNTGISRQSVTEAGAGHLNDDRYDRLSIMSQFGLPASAFYATERVMGLGLPQYECQLGSSVPSHQYSGEIANQSFRHKAVSQPALESNFFGNRYSECFDNSHGGNSLSLSGNKRRFPEEYKLAGNSFFAFTGRHVPFLFQTNQDRKVNSNSYGLPPTTQLSFLSHHEMQSSGFCNEGVSVSSGNPHSNQMALSRKTRIRWTRDLHEKFVECVDQLGGAEKATPKAILKLMDLNGLTICHVKSHLQKYRMAKYIPDSSQGKARRITSTSTGTANVSQIDEEA